MGWDYITYEGSQELFDDFDLWVLRHFFVEEARALETEHASPDQAELHEFLKNWEWFGPGVFSGTDLSDYISANLERWELFLHLLQRAGDRIARFGAFIPLDYMEAHVNTPMSYFTKAPPTYRYLISIGRICKLLSRHEPQAN